MTMSDYCLVTNSTSEYVGWPILPRAQKDFFQIFAILHMYAYFIWEQVPGPETNFGTDAPSSELYNAIPNNSRELYIKGLKMVEAGTLLDDGQIFVEKPINKNSLLKK